MIFAITKLFASDATTNYQLQCLRIARTRCLACWLPPRAFVVAAVVDTGGRGACTETC